MEEEEEEDRPRQGILATLDAMAEHYHEHRREMLTRWSWPFFAIAWARMLDYARREERRRKRRDEKQEEERREREVGAMLAEHRASRGMSGDEVVE